MRADHPAGSSRTSESGAGWECAEPGTFGALMPGTVPEFSWRRPSVLWRSRNDVVARWFGDPTGERRRRWVAGQIDAGVDRSFAMPGPAGEFSMLVVGDTGEGDRSQYAVVPGLLNAGAGTDFMVIASDVIYPVGSANDYPEKFFRPYRDYPGPIFAVPGNHDWYDGLTGFMRVFCGARTAAPADAGPWRGPFGLVARLLWRSPEAVDEEAFEAGRRLRDTPAQRTVQPGPYWMIDTPLLRIVGIDTGIVGRIDREQGAWLREVSKGDRPKLLITGKPLYVDSSRRPCPIEGGGTVLELVEDPAHHYVATIGGDIHNYQRYPLPSPGGRTIQHIVSGGGGAFMHATHTIPRAGVVPEHEFRCYPLRGDSLAVYSRLYGRWSRMPRLFELTPDQAGAVVAERIGMPVTRPAADGTAVRPSRRARAVAALLGVPCGRRHRVKWLRLPVRKLPQRFRSEFADWDSPPFFKSFLRLDVTAESLRIRCFAATGCREQELRPPVEDEVVVPLAVPVAEPPAFPPLVPPAAASTAEPVEPPADPAVPPRSGPVVPPQPDRAARPDPTPPAPA